MVEEKSYSIPCFASLRCKRNRKWYSTFPVNIFFLFIWPYIESRGFEKVKSEYASPISNAYNQTTIRDCLVFYILINDETIYY